MWKSSGAFVLLVLCLAATNDANAQAYSLLDLGSLGGGSSYGTAINSAGQVVGYSLLAGPAPATQQHAFLYTPSTGSMQDIGTLGGTGSTLQSAAYGINDAGEITGEAQLSAQGAEYPFLYSNGAMAAIDAVAGVGNAVNSSGWVTGYVGCNGGSTCMFLYANDTLQGFQAPAGPVSYGNGINASGQIVGQTGFANGYQAFSFTLNGGYQDLVVGTPRPYNTSTAAAINAEGQVTGNLTYSDGAIHAFLYTAGVFQDLGTLTAYPPNSYGNAINSAGQVVGWSGVTGVLHQAAFIYTNGQLLDLNSLLVDNTNQVKLLVATAINDNGWIVANGEATINGGSPEHAYLLIPVNPSVGASESTDGPMPFWALAALGTGLVGIASRRFKTAV